MSTKPKCTVCFTSSMWTFNNSSSVYTGFLKLNVKKYISHALCLVWCGGKSLRRCKRVKRPSLTEK